MSESELPKAYNPVDHEQKLYSMWEKSGAFAPNQSIVNRRSSTAFSIIMPPPNANGALHIGHAVYVTLQDLMIRYHRMKGDETLWLPGADHAGFETQVVFEKHLEKQGQSRFDFDRETLYKMMLDFTLENQRVMENQLRRLGASCDWSRAKFTLDPDIVHLVYETFKELYEDGLAYRAEGIVNWCPKHQTALSGLEVKYIEQKNPLYFLKYGPVVIATARPETKFGDKYVVVHPRDKRYQQFHHGQKLPVDWINGQITATLIKDPIIDMTFGTGAMTITPAHDAADFTLAKKYNLEIEPIIDFSGRLKSIAGPLAGLKIKPARAELLKILKAKQLLEKIDENYVHSVAVCYKCQTPIEPQVRMQWWLKMTENSKFKIQNSKIKEHLGKSYSLRDVAVAAVKSGEVKFVTRRFEKVFLHWMSILEDWNLSRQIVWGIQLPVWYCRGCNQIMVELPKETSVYAIRHGQAEHNVTGILNGDPAKQSNLTAAGRQQARVLGQQLKGVRLDRIIVSQMPRTQQTAKLIFNDRHIPVEVDQRLNDIWVGELEGQPLNQVRQQTEYFSQSISGSETLDAVRRRCQEFFNDVLDRYPGQTIAIVSSEIILHSLRQITRGDDQNELAVNHPKTGTYERLNFSWPNQCLRCGGRLERDPDVFDTWFSSGQWPFATLLASRGSNSKLNKDDFKKFYPTTVMETGWDILFFWVARMIMLGLYKTGDVPFRYVYLHGLVRDKDRQKMSKSKGNVIDPLGVADLYGADAVRMALIFGTSAGNDIVISEDKIRGMRNLANKIWNVGRFIIGRISELEVKIVKGAEITNFLTAPKGRPNLLTESDKIMWSNLQETIKIVTESIERFRFHQAAEVLYDFTWHEYADKYIETAKKQLNDPKLKENTQQLLVISFELLVKLLHPFMPFVSEATWQEMYDRKLVNEPLLINVDWPKISKQSNLKPSNFLTSEGDTPERPNSPAKGGTI